MSIEKKITDIDHIDHKDITNITKDGITTNTIKDEILDDITGGTITTDHHTKHDIHDKTIDKTIDTTKKTII